ncbi:CheR family methyltransferase [Silvanigrella sp.]|jgi:chemotaxis protein methyltransferase CheR|uniref:CheR family methyltransferase n=1 Tax=Silvanigrella sp. TaxID=2024976 RepID=UPI0037C723A0
METYKENLIKYFSSLIEIETGIQYDETNKYLLLTRIQNLLKLINISSIDSLWNEIQTNGLNSQIKSLILDLATNNETSFFRDPKVFEFLKTEFVPKIMANKNRIRIWCAATSTGQEPYSIAIIMAELKELGMNKSYEILATDISDRVLKQAEKGIYSPLEVQRGLSPELLKKYFNEEISDLNLVPNYKVKSEISSFITYKQLNLLHPWPNFEPFDIIFCRNVLIYQSIENKKNVISKFAKLLNPEGYLVLGGAESLLQLSNDYDLINFNNITIHKLKTDFKN